MFNFSPHIELTLYTIFLYFLTNYVCYDKKISYKFMKMFNIKNKSSMQMICLALFGIGFYFLSNGMVHKRQFFTIGGEEVKIKPTNLVDTASDQK